MKHTEELMKQVERVVRPIRARRPRKDRMRAELLAHLTDIYEEELARLDNDRAAVEQAIRRFGEPEQLRRQLQDSVPFLERVLFVEFKRGWLGRRETETALQHELRMMRTGLVFVVVFDVSAVTVRSMMGSSVDTGGIVGFTAGVLPNMACLCILLTLLNDGMRKAICRGFAASRSLLRAVVYGVLSSVVVVLSGVGFALSINSKEGYAMLKLSHLPWLIAVALLTPFLLALYAVLTARDIRRFEQDEWRRLEIEQ